MNFLEKITGSDITKAAKDFEARVQKLPESYQAACKEIVNCLLPYGDFSGRNLLPVFNGLTELLEIAAADGQSIEEVLGSDVQSFCKEIASAEGLKGIRDKWRAQLNKNVAKKLGEL